VKRGGKGDIRKSAGEAKSTGEAISEGINFDNLNFVFAKTMAEIPHYYVKRSVENEKDYVALFNTILKVGVVQKWRGHRYRYWYRGDGYKYWTMTTDLRQSIVINRARVDEPASQVDEVQ
jgi:hypothetical protein